jgi:hypothetical protein
MNSDQYNCCCEVPRSEFLSDARNQKTNCPLFFKLSYGDVTRTTLQHHARGRRSIKEKGQSNNSSLPNPPIEDDESIKLSQALKASVVPSVVPTAGLPEPFIDDNKDMALITNSR